MEKQRSQNRLIYPYLILAIALVCTALILFDLWTTVDDQVPFPWEGPSPTPTLWWRTPEAATPAPPSSAIKPAFTAPITQGTPVPVADTFMEFIDG